MAFEGLADRLQKTISKIRGKGKSQRTRRKRDDA